MSIDAGNCRDARQLKLIKPNLMPININLRLPANWKSQQTAFIRLDKNRNGKIDYKEVEDEVQTLY